MNAYHFVVGVENGSGKVELSCSLSGVEMEALLGVDKLILDLTADFAGAEATIALALDH